MATWTREALMKEAFDLLSQDGKIPRAMLPMALRAAGLNPSEVTVKVILSEEGGADMAAYQRLVEKYDDKMNTLEALKDAFRLFDRNHDGTVSSIEFRHIMTTLGEKYTDEEFSELIDGYEVDGAIEYERLSEAMLAPFPTHAPRNI